MDKFDYEKNYKYFALGFMVLLGIFLFYGLSMFLQPFLGAIIFYILSRPLAIHLIYKKNLNKNLTAIIIIVITFLILVVPVLGVGYMLVNKITGLLAHPEGISEFLSKIQKFINAKIHYDILSDDAITQVRNFAAGIVSTVLNQSVSIFTDISIMYFILFFMLTANTSMENALIEYLPYSEHNVAYFQKELIAQTYSNAIVTPLLALIQGIFATIGYWIFGVQEALFWGLMTGVFSFMPIVGSTIVWVPLCIFQFASGDTFNAIGVLGYGLLVTTNVDNVFRFIFQKKFANVHPLITLMGFLFGIKFFGFSGIIFGPLLISFFLIMVRLFKKEYIIRPRKSPRIMEPEK